MNKDTFSNKFWEIVGHAGKNTTVNKFIAVTILVASMLFLSKMLGKFLYYITH